MEIINKIWPILVAILLFLLVIIIHELGHFIFAKLFKVKVNEFAVGFGPTLFKRQKGETTYAVRAVPFGGFCAMEGEDTESEDSNAFGTKKAWKRMIIIAAGAIFNLILGFIITFVMVVSQPSYATTTVGGFNDLIGRVEVKSVAGDGEAEVTFVGGRITAGGDAKIIRNKEEVATDKVLEVTYGSEATEEAKYDKTNPDTAVSVRLESFTDLKPGDTIDFTEEPLSSKTGLKEGDTITKVNGRTVRTDSDLSYQLLTDKDGVFDMTVKRDGKSVKLTDVSFKMRYDEEIKKNIVSQEIYVTSVPRRFTTVITQSGAKFVSTARMIWFSLIDLVSGKFGISEMSGPVGIVKEVSNAASTSMLSLMNIAAFITINLGVFNLLPLPALDGGRLIFLLIEAFRKKPVPAKYEGLVHGIGFAILLIFIGVVTFSDIFKLFT